MALSQDSALAMPDATFCDPMECKMWISVLSRIRGSPRVIGSLTALAFVLIIGSTERFQCGKQIASYLWLVPSEESSGDRRRLGHITKQGNSLLRFLLVEGLTS